MVSQVLEILVSKCEFNVKNNQGLDFERIVPDKSLSLMFIKDETGHVRILIIQDTWEMNVAGTH